MVITFTLQQAYSGSTYEAGPFNISGVTNTGVVTELGSNISKSTLLSGYTANDVDDATTGGTINSTGTCTTSRPWTVSGGGTTPTPTPTPTPTITPIEPTEYEIQGYAESRGEACDRTGGTYVSLNQISLYAAESDPLNVTKFYNNQTPTLSNPYINGDIPNGYFLVFVKAIGSPTDFYTVAYNNSTGDLSSQAFCF
jgi:hypothetical protein